MDGGVLVEAILLPAFPLTPPTVNSYKLHLCSFEKYTKEEINKTTFKTTGRVCCVIILSHVRHKAPFSFTYVAN